MADGLPKHVDELCDSIDAAVFSGDSLYNRAAIKKFKWYLDRWGKELINIELAVEDYMSLFDVEKKKK